MEISILSWFLVSSDVNRWWSHVLTFLKPWRQQMAPHCSPHTFLKNSRLWCSEAGILHTPVVLFSSIKKRTIWIINFLDICTKWLKQKLPRSISAEIKSLLRAISNWIFPNCFRMLERLFSKAAQTNCYQPYFYFRFSFSLGCLHFCCLSLLHYMTMIEREIYNIIVKI